ncbi:MAG: ABC transporter permease [Lachnospiraceae bacterium]|jgi:ABC-2 type transport system permease protein|nr:ABC transporter permease [Lachnospiraceae bacterium]
MTHIARRIIKQIVGDKRSLALIMLMPILLLSLLYLLLGENTYVPLVLTEQVPQPFVDRIAATGKVDFISFFLIFLFSGISFVRERTSDTVERLMLTPVQTAEVVGGYVLGFAVFALLQSGIMILYARFVLKMPFVGNWWLALLLMLLLAMTAVVTGVLVSALSKNEFQVMQFIPVIIIPQVFFSGIIPIDTIPYNLGALAKVMPIYYGCMGLRAVLIYGQGLAEILPQILVLLLMIALLFAANVAAVKKYRG